MQHQSLIVFCEVCGLANEPKASHCASCQHSLMLKPDESISTPFAQAVAPRILPAQSKQAIPTALSQYPACDFQSGSILAGRYQIQEEVGQGGFSTVYKAVDQKSGGINGLVAIKRIQLNQLSSSQIIDATETFNREVAMLPRLKGMTGIPAYYEHLADNQNWYLITQFIEGSDFGGICAERSEWLSDEKEVINLGIEIANIMYNLHINSILK